MQQSGAMVALFYLECEIELFFLHFILMVVAVVLLRLLPFSVFHDCRWVNRKL